MPSCWWRPVCSDWGVDSDEVKTVSVDHSFKMVIYGRMESKGTVQSQENFICVKMWSCKYLYA